MVLKDHNEMADNPPGAYLSYQENLYYHICKWYIRNPIADQENILQLIEFFTPSWYFSNGYFEYTCTDWLLEKLIYSKRLVENEIFSRVRVIHFVQLYVPKKIQERLMVDTYE